MSIASNQCTNPPQSTPGHKPGAPRPTSQTIAMEALLPQVLCWLIGDKVRYRSFRRLIPPPGN